MIRARIEGKEEKNTTKSKATKMKKEGKDELKDPGRGKSTNTCAGPADRFVRSPRNRDRGVDPRIGKKMCKRKKGAAARRGTLSEPTPKPA